MVEEGMDCRLRKMEWIACQFGASGCLTSEVFCSEGNGAELGFGA